jgi:hypothetical protein
MQVTISAFPSAPRDITDAANAAIDARSFDLDQEEWNDFTARILDGKTDELCIHDTAGKITDFLHSNACVASADPHTADQFEIAEMLRVLITAGMTHDCDRIGIAG